jgi:hypothetical protein
MRNDLEDDEQSCDCRICEQPMKLIRRLPRIGAAPELLVFYCRECNEVDSAEWRQAPPPRNSMALN